jgi:pimeloyl-ACP methyl ester carboxylesterase
MPVMLLKVRPVRRLILILALVLLVVFAPYAWGHVRAASLVVRAAGMHGWWADSLADLQATPFTTEDTHIDVRAGRIRSRFYRPETVRTRAVLLTGGVHAKGIDEPRLMKFASDLARGGTPVVTAEIPDLVQYRITRALTDTIEDAAAWASSQPSIAPDGKIGLFGISFAGGLSISAASRPRVRDKVAFVVSLGGHGDLARVGKFLCSGILPDGSYRKPHDYGVVITLINLADHLVPPDQVEPLRAAIIIFLTASHLDMVDKPAAAKTFAHARDVQQTLPEPARTLMGYVNDRNVKALGAALLPYASSFGNDPSLSPELATGLTAPVFLIHGADDNVVPAMESTVLAAHLRQQVPVHLLVTPLITHAEVDRNAGAADVWHLIRFWFDVFHV